MLVAVGEPPPRPSVAPTHFMYPVVNYVKDTDVTFTKKTSLEISGGLGCVQGDRCGCNLLFSCAVLVKSLHVATKFRLTKWMINAYLFSGSRCRMGNTNR